MRETAKIEKKPKVDPMANWPKKPFVVGQKVKLAAEVNALKPGTVVEVTVVQFEGKTFKVKTLDGLKEFRIKAADLE